MCVIEYVHKIFSDIKGNQIMPNIDVALEAYTMYNRLGFKACVYDSEGKLILGEEL